MNATEDELATLAGTDETGTTMYGLAQAAQSKGLIAKGLKLSVSQLRTNNIVFLTINGEGHYCIVTNITDTTVYLADTDLGNINMTVANFTAAYSGNALIVTNDTNDPQLNTGSELTNQEMQSIKGTFYMFAKINYYVTALFYGGNLGTRNAWMHIIVRRNPHITGWLVIQCGIYYWVGGKKFRISTQHWVLMGGGWTPWMGGSKTFKFKVPYMRWPYSWILTARFWI